MTQASKSSASHHLGPNPNPVNMTSEERQNDAPPPEEGPSAKKIKYTEKELDDGVKALVKHYGLDKLEAENLALRAKENEAVPTIEEVEWVVEEAQLRSDGEELNWPMFYYMEFYPWYLRSHGDDHRVFVGTFKSFKGGCDLWVSFTPKSQLHYNFPVAGRQKQVFRLKVELRRFIRWHTSFQELFRLSSFDPESIRDTAGAKKAQAQQTAYIKAAMKVLARFPGLILERYLHDDELRYQLHGAKWDAFPFWNKEARSDENPLDDLFEALIKKEKKVKTTKKTKAGPSKGKKKAAKSSELADSDHDMDDDEVEGEVGSELVHGEDTENGGDIVMSGAL